MRLDKFLKVSRIIKRRQVAKEVADQGRIKINDRIAKSSSTVSVGDTLEIRFGQRIATFEVLELNESTKKQDAEKMFRLVDEQPIDSEKSEPEFYE